ncbi:MAG: cytochrome c peroxidase [Ferruginibacter sp.]
MYQKKIIVLLVLFTGSFTLSFIIRPDESPVFKVRKTYAQGLDSLETQLLKLQSSIETGNDKTIHKTFLETRLCYKKIEWIMEYFFKYQADHINGPPIPVADETEPELPAAPPQGLQMVESFLYPSSSKESRETAITYITKMLKHVKEGKQVGETFKVTDENIFDALIEELFRIQALTVTGADSPLAFLSVQEATASLSGVQLAFSWYAAEIEKAMPGKYEQLDHLLEDAKKYLAAAKDFNKFDRLGFITHYLDPATKITGEYKLIKGYRDNPASMFYSVVKKQNSLYEKNIFNPGRYIDDNTTDSYKIALGKLLFADPALSANNKRSCASCHQPSKAFTDGLHVSVELDGHSPLSRNAPTLWNAALQRSMFHDGRSRTLEDQVMSVLNNKKEMHGSAQQAAEKIIKERKYAGLYAKAFPNTSAEKAAYNVCNAIACYERTLLSFNSRFDQYMRGNTTMMNNSEINGFNLFMGKGKCGTCHFMPLFNGSRPPRYYYQDFEVLGVPGNNDKKKPFLDKDSGRYNFSKLGFQQFAFKTPTVRNIELTGPYMHNGVFNTLEEVVDFYNKGGGKGLNIAPENQTLPFDKLNLTDREKKDIVAFMKTLTDTTGLQ